MHSRSTYDETEAMAIWTHVRDFMQSLSAHGIPEIAEEPQS
jgi:hypothetical protein